MTTRLGNRVKGALARVDLITLWPEDYNPQSYYVLPNGPKATKFYDSIAIPSPEQQLQFLRDSWTTEAQRVYNRTHTACPRCRGKGYTRKDANVGCIKCQGTGAISNDQDTFAGDSASAGSRRGQAHA